MKQQSLTEPSLQGLLSIINEQRAKAAALEKRKQFLQYILAQRIKVTENKYHEKKQHFDKMTNLVHKIFLDNPATSFTYNQGIEEFRVKYPTVPYANVPRRMRDLFDRGKLWKDYDSDTREARYWLKLEENEENEATTRENTA